MAEGGSYETLYGCVVVVGTVGSGKSTALNNIFGLNFEAGSSSTSVTQVVCNEIVQKNGMSFHVFDIPGLEGSSTISTESVVKEIVTTVNEVSSIVLLYCLSVKPGDNITETDGSIVKSLTSQFGIPVWDRCVLLLTFSDLAKEEFKENTDSYISYLQNHIQAFSRLLLRCGAARHSEIKLASIDNRPNLESFLENGSSRKVVAIPTMSTRNNSKTVNCPGTNTNGWVELALEEIVKKLHLPKQNTICGAKKDGECGYL